MKSKIIIICECLIIVFLIIFATSKNIDYESRIYNDSINKSINLATMAEKLEENIKNDIYQSKNQFTGDLTGYNYNCPLCSGKLACQYDYNISDGKTFFSDPSYGDVRIVASSQNLPCGSIVRFNLSRVSDQPVVAIVLDRGVRGNALDLLTEDLPAARKIGRASITYDVLREGFGS